MAVTVDQTLAHLRRREARQRARIDARTERLRGRLPAAAALLRERGAVRVIAFGSLVAGDSWAHSDVDLAVSGLAPDRYFRALADLVALFECHVDLVCLEDAGASLVGRVEEEGRPL